MSCCGDETQVKEITPMAAKTQETLTVTHEAAKYALELMKKDNKEGWGLKVEVAPGGCAGYKYFMAFQEKAEPEDRTYEFHGLKVFLNLMSVGFIKGSSIEYVSSLEASGLKINNPNATRACGCGKSFA